MINNGFGTDITKELFQATLGYRKSMYRTRQLEARDGGRTCQLSNQIRLLGPVGILYDEVLQHLCQVNKS